MFPEKQSISTVRLNEMKEYEAAGRGPGTYGKGQERQGQHRSMGNNLHHAFGTNDSRKLDNRTLDVVENPGPNHYDNTHKTNSLSVKEKDRISAIFKAKGRSVNYSASIGNPGPASYNTESYDAIGHKGAQGGSPNNILTLKKAEDKIISDHLFPFIVKDRLPIQKDLAQAQALGPGKYSIAQSPFANKHTQSNRSYNNSSSTRFEEKSLLNVPGPGHYQINSDPLLQKSNFTFSKRFSPSAQNLIS